ncbi:unnamed protein product [Amoebophrya sp. A25]|nr:unnamed protein product [Amoebophrya sp. A25]|eukprot:GSA25T00000434001.1
MTQRHWLSSVIKEQKEGGQRCPQTSLKQVADSVVVLQESISIARSNALALMHASSKIKVNG